MDDSGQFKVTQDSYFVSKSGSSINSLGKKIFNESFNEQQKLKFYWVSIVPTCTKVDLIGHSSDTMIVNSSDTKKLKCALFKVWI